jgi:hypothetical protein
VLGAALVVVGAWLVISDTTGFLLAGLVESFGFALFGFWLVSLSRSMASAGRWPRLLPTLGIATGVLLIIGLILAPGIVMGLDDMDSAPWWVWVGFVGWLGIFVLLPIWSIWLAAALRRGSAPVAPLRGRWGPRRRPWALVTLTSTPGRWGPARPLEARSELRSGR